MVGGWVEPLGEQVDRWTITAVHARYVAPAVTRPYVDGWGRESATVVRPELRAYLVDLAGRYALPDMAGVLIYQTPKRWWMLREADPETLQRYEQYRVGQAAAE